MHLLQRGRNDGPGRNGEEETLTCPPFFPSLSSVRRRMDGWSITEQQQQHTEGRTLNANEWSLNFCSGNTTNTAWQAKFCKFAGEAKIEASVSKRFLISKKERREFEGRRQTTRGTRVSNPSTPTFHRGLLPFKSSLAIDFYSLFRVGEKKISHNSPYKFPKLNDRIDSINISLSRLENHGRWLTKVIRKHAQRISRLCSVRFR